VFGTGGDSTANKERLVPGINLAGGLEYQISANISLRAEYDYSQFSSVRLVAPLSIFQSAPDNFKVSPVLQTARLGLAYNF
jgi:opacity protein-like surface antigen